MFDDGHNQRGNLRHKGLCGLSAHLINVFDTQSAICTSWMHVGETKATKERQENGVYRAQ